MKAMTEMLVVETKLLTRDLGNVIFGLLFPAVLLLVLGAIPGFTDPDPALGGARLIDLYTPIVLVLTLAMVGISSLGVSLTSARKEGVLRRLRVTPVGPTRLLGAKFVSHLGLALAGSALALVAALTVHDVGGPQSWLGFVLGLVLTAAAMFSVGGAIGALAPGPSAANAIAPIVWMPLMVLAGLWFPREAMPDTMRRISDLSPGGAAVDAVQRAWFSGEIQVASLLVLTISVVLIGSLAVATFRWE